MKFDLIGNALHLLLAAHGSAEAGEVAQRSHQSRHSPTALRAACPRSGRSSARHSRKCDSPRRDSRERERHLLFQYTMNMKKVEVPVRRIIEGQKLSATGSLANPDSLDYYRSIPELSQW